MGCPELLKEEQKLTMKESLFLNLYERFYGIKYDITDDTLLSDGKTRVKHLRGQALVFLISQFIRGLFDYYFSWDKSGPYSEELSQFMKGLDTNESLKNKIVNIDISKYIKPGYLVEINRFIESFSEFVNKTQNAALTDDMINYNAEIIASLLYISKSLYSVNGFNEINAELLKQKEWASDYYNNKKIWDVLSKFNLVPNY